MNNVNKLNIYILNWNQADITVDCVKSIINQSSPLEKEIYIIDNGSQDDSIEIFKKTFPNLRIIENESNLGFQGGMNQGIKHALENSADYVLLLNNDTVADENMLEMLFLHLPCDAALVSPGIYYYDNRDILCSLGGNFHPLFLEVMGRPNSNYSPPDKVKNFDFLPSHAWLIKTEIFRTVGLLDEIFFPIYYDDLDFCLRMKRQGYKLYLIPQAKIYHRISLSVGGRNSPNERYLMARNSGYYFRKNMKIWQYPFVFCFRIGSSFLWTLRLLGKKNYESLKSYWQGIYEGWWKDMPNKDKNY